MVLNLFLPRGTLESEKKLAAHLYLELLKRTSKELHFTNFNQKISYFSQYISKSKYQKDFAAHLEGVHGTLVYRGTPVEKH